MLSTEVLQRRLGKMDLGPAGDGPPSFLDETHAGRLGLTLSKSAFSVESGGMVAGHGRFALVARESGLVVEHVYLKLHSLARCPLRTETTATQLPATHPSYAVWLTDRFQDYDLVPQAEPGQTGVWRYDSPGSDEIGLRVYAEPYTLFLVSLVAEVRDDAHSSQRSAVESPIFPVLFLEKGNSGGCLALAEWLRPEAFVSPTRASFRNEFNSLLAYQLATLDWENSYGFLEKAEHTSGALLDAATSDLERVANVLPQNLLIAKNLTAWKTMLGRPD
ncbi:MAG: hypothetical protein U0414_21855 [Polyangiaceae bacterium]